MARYFHKCLTYLQDNKSFIYYIIGKSNKSIVFLFLLWYNNLATQLNIWTNYRRSVFCFGKSTLSILAFSCSLSEVVSQQSELCVFQCVASAAYFFFFIRRRVMRMTKCKKCGKVYPMNMSNCPECFEKRRLPTGLVVGITICIIVLAICFGAIIGIIVSEDSTSDSQSGIENDIENESEIKYIEISANDIYSAFQENEIAADEKFNGKLVKITGIISSINSSGILTSANILLSVDGSFFGCVQCNFNSTNSKALANIEKGQSVTIIGTCGGLASFNVMINACELQQ